ncbi:E3 ubiquitin ligase component cereblon isoform X2 [Leptinotarsa decemlineata]|uniref:E3 ubiquitin ligase component cereblon isoform X2 n=1 Tax=Leptinotarsa decemlineata TaxID=7539 RepID=UPI000C2544FB|nr:protein cereblon isoform X2 [Leptinotarsa decemlineata]
MSDRENRDTDDDDDEGYPPMELVENGYFTSNVENSDSSDDEGNDDDPDSYPSNDGEFDRDLPTTHRYLGKLDSVTGYTLYDDGEVMNILAIYTTTMVFPGFTLPLVMNTSEETSIMQTFIEKNNVFVLLCANSILDGIFNFGVTMEIFETQMLDNVLNIKARGRQRCQLVSGTEVKSWTGRLKQVTIKIKAEPEISSPLCDTQMVSLKQKRLLMSSQFSDILKNYKFRRYHLAQYPLASWLYDRYEVCYYVKILLEGLAHYVGEYIPNDPVKLSYWFVQNYQLSHEERLDILKLNSTLERLKLECKYLTYERIICCSRCNANITDPTKVFAMSKDGIQSNYVNPGGHVYETVTVLEAQNFRLNGNPSKQFSWFPGYAWTTMQCKSCANHLGWRFTSTNLRPQSFYGLAKIGIKVIIYKKIDSKDEEEINSRPTSFTRDYIPA